MNIGLYTFNALQIRVDHRSECIHFGADLSESQREDLPEGPMLQSLPSETIRCQLVQMGSAIQSCLDLIVPDNRKVSWIFSSQEYNYRLISVY